MTRAQARRACAALIFIVAFSSPSWAQAPVRWTAPDGTTAINVGLFAQGSASLDTASDRDAVGDLCFRRLRFIASGKVASKLKFFIDSDTPYLGHHGAAGWGVPPTYIQDFILTAELRDEFQVDAGWLMVPLSYNTTQSATSLLAIGYGPYSFLASAPTGSRVGRDQGVQVRGYLFKKRFEYRAGTFRGASKDSSAPLRYAARVAWYPFGAQTGFFYSGTAHGQKKMLVIGSSVDVEGHYRANGLDAYLEWPLANRDTLTLQADFLRYDGGTTFTQLPLQNTWLFEGGYRFGGTPFGAYGQVARQDIRAAGAADATTAQAGVTCWLKGHRLNLKAGIGRTMKDGTVSHTQVLGQVQVLAF